MLVTLGNCWITSPKIVGVFFLVGAKFGGMFGGNFAGFFSAHKIKAQKNAGKFSEHFS